MHDSFVRARFALSHLRLIELTPDNDPDVTGRATSKKAIQAETYPRSEFGFWERILDVAIRHNRRSSACATPE